MVLSMFKIHHVIPLEMCNTSRFHLYFFFYKKTSSHVPPFPHEDQGRKCVCVGGGAGGGGGGFKIDYTRSENINNIV